MIFISAGHHISRQGASYNGVTEFELAVKWVDLIVELLGGKATRVPNGTLKVKVDFINANVTPQSIAVEIHFNSAQIWKDLNANGVIDDDEMKHVGRGSETLYYPGSVTGKVAAQLIQDALGQIFKPCRGIKKGWYQMNPAKGIDYFLKRTRCTSLIIEPEFIDNLDKINNNINAGCYSIASTLLEAERDVFKGVNIK